MQIKHSLKRHLIGAGILGAVALIAFTDSDAPASGDDATDKSAQAAATAFTQLSIIAPATGDATSHTTLPLAALSTEAQAQALQRAVLQTERQVAALRRQGGDANAVYRLRAGALPAATVAGLMQREDAEAGMRPAGNAAALPPPLRQE
ncbi:hypothetical protein [Pseudoduganella violacea]|uniref:Uncharacterized protein n=1 Tax=Pseudoduganella violacea TaxID=1715466 RepID=A0A7W5BA70_9BURK|nr:hypothetical protein [Pseudoduganella violacea]MBB3119364.1 hypothetical protein [Pseudoduganella violacea]